jgi:hypothetical protein
MNRCESCGRIKAHKHTCPEPIDFILKFWSFVQKTETCLLWNGALNARGYGRSYLGGGRKAGLTLAHRFAWILEHGPIPAGFNVLHRCDVRRCVRVGHLFLGTCRDNSLDMSSKGRQWLQRAPRNVQLASAEHMRAMRGR